MPPDATSHWYQSPMIEGMRPGWKSCLMQGTSGSRQGGSWTLAGTAEKKPTSGRKVGKDLQSPNISLIPHITMWGSCFSLCTRRSAAAPPPGVCRPPPPPPPPPPPLTPLILHHSSYSTHLTPLISHHSSHTTHLTPVTTHHSSDITHLTQLILHHSGWAAGTALCEPGVKISWQAQHTEPSRGRPRLPVVQILLQAQHSVNRSAAFVAGAVRRACRRTGWTCGRCWLADACRVDFAAAQHSVNLDPVNHFRSRGRRSTQSQRTGGPRGRRWAAGSPLGRAWLSCGRRSTQLRRAFRVAGAVHRAFGRSCGTRHTHHSSHTAHLRAVFLKDSERKVWLSVSGWDRRKAPKFLGKP